MPIFCIKSVKIYTGPKKFTRVYPWLPWQIWGMCWMGIICRSSPKYGDPGSARCVPGVSPTQSLGMAWTQIETSTHSHTCTCHGGLSNSSLGKITWDTPNYALGPWHSLVQICATVDMCQRNIGSLTRPLSLLLVSLPIVLACFDCALVKHQSHLFSLLIVSTFVISWSPA